MSTFTGSLEKTLHTTKHRMTKQRRQILSVLDSGGLNHPSASEIHKALADSERPISLATVYNTLSFFVSVGMIKVIEFESVENRYDLNVDPHVNLICLACGEISDLHEEIDVSGIRVEESSGFSVEDYRFDYYGTCVQCRSLESSTPAGVV